MKKSTERNILIGGGLVGGALLLYLALNKDSSSGSSNGDGGGLSSIIQREIDKVTEAATNTIASTTVSVLEAPGKVILGVPKAALEASEKSTSTDAFNGAKKANLNGFLGGPDDGTPKTYDQWIANQPIAARVPVALGNILTGNQAANYGAYSAEQTKKAIIAAPAPGYATTDEMVSQSFARLSPVQASSVALGSAVSVPFVNGGAAGLGASVANTPAKKAVVGAELNTLSTMPGATGIIAGFYNGIFQAAQGSNSPALPAPDVTKLSPYVASPATLAANPSIWGNAPGSPVYTKKYAHQAV